MENENKTWIIGKTEFKMVNDYCSGLQFDAIRKVSNVLNKAVMSKDLPSLFDFSSNDLSEFLSAILTPVDINEWDETVQAKNKAHFKKSFPTIETLESIFDFFVSGRAKYLGSWTWRWRMQDLMIEEAMKIKILNELTSIEEELQD